MVQILSTQVNKQKNRPVEILPGMGEGDKGVYSCIIYLMYCKNFQKCHNVLPPSTTI
jgi:hypothetical protein